MQAYTDDVKKEEDDEEEYKDDTFFDHSSDKVKQSPAYNSKASPNPSSFGKSNYKSQKRIKLPDSKNVNERIARMISQENTTKFNPVVQTVKQSDLRHSKKLLSTQVSNGSLKINSDSFMISH